MNNPFKIIIITLCSVLFACSASKMSMPPADEPVEAPIVTSEDFKIIKNESNSVLRLTDMISELKGADVVIIGETHNDPVAHHIELEVVKGIYNLSGKAAVSMEMFERDVQHVIDEYLDGHIQESFLLKDARAWKNYETDYKPVVEFAKENGLKVIAANAPRRYVRIVSTKGLEALSGIPVNARKYLPPLPVKMPPDNAYQKKFFKLMMGNMPAMMKKDETGQKKSDKKTPAAAPHMQEKMSERVMRTFHAQVLWDASMAYSIGESYKNDPTVPVVHLVGSFHSENRLGMVQHLRRDFPDMRIVTITVKVSDNYPDYDPGEIRDIADFIVIANGKIQRTY